MNKLLDFKKAVEITRSGCTLVTSCAQPKQSNQNLATLVKVMDKSLILINLQTLTSKNLVQNVKIGYFSRNRFYSNHQKTTNKEKESVEGK
jgi:hypothetical protein